MRSIKSWNYGLLALQLLLFFPVMVGTADTVRTFQRLKSPDPVDRLHAMEEMTRYYFHENMNMALYYAKKELELASGIGNLEFQNRSCIHLGIIFLAISEYDSASIYLKRAVTGTKKAGDKKRLCSAYALLGQIFFNKEDRLESLKYLKLAVATDSVDNLDLIDVYAKLGIIVGDAGNITRSMEFFNKALEVSRAKKDTSENGYIYSSIAGIFSRISNMEKCIEYYQKALDVFTRANNLRGQAYILNDLGMTYDKLNKDRQALECYKQSLSIRVRVNDLQGIAFTMTNTGDIFLKIHQPDSAFWYYGNSLKYSEVSGDKLSKGCTYLSLGRYYMETKNFSKAVTFLQQSLKLAKELNFRVNLEEIYLLLSEVYNKTGNPEESLEFLKKRNAVRDSNLHVRAQAVVTEMMIKYETGEKKEQISKLNEEVHLKNEKIRNGVLAILGLFCLVFITLAIIYYYYREKVKPKVRALDQIRNKFSEIKNKDERRMKSIKKMLPSEFDTSDQREPAENDLPMAFARELEELMTRDKVFLNENLSLSEVATMLKTNTSYLSRLINDHYGQNFNNFINRFRIEEAKELIKNRQHEQLSYEGIAKSAGFRSKSSFNEAFRKFTNMTPGEYATSFTSESTSPHPE